jgi:hypothetical protein
VDKQIGKSDFQLQWNWSGRRGGTIEDFKDWRRSVRRFEPELNWKKVILEELEEGLKEGIGIAGQFCKAIRLFVPVVSGMTLYLPPLDLDWHLLDKGLIAFG